MNFWEFAAREPSTAGFIVLVVCLTVVLLVFIGVVAHDKARSDKANATKERQE